MRCLLLMPVVLLLGAPLAGHAQSKSLPELRWPVLSLPVRSALGAGGRGGLAAPASVGGLRALAGTGGAVDPLSIAQDEPDDDEEQVAQSPMNRGRWGFVTPWVAEPEDILDLEGPAPEARVSRGALQVRSLGTLAPARRQLPVLRYGMVRYAPPGKDQQPDLGLVILPYDRKDDDDLRDLGLTVTPLKGAARPREGERRATVPNFRRGMQGMFNLGFGQFNPSFMGLDFGIPNLGAGADISQYLYNPAAAVLPSVFGRIR